MPENIKINLKNAMLILSIVLVLASVTGSGYITHDNAKEAKTKAASNEKEINALKIKQARFEGKIDERTANTLERVNLIYEIVNGWEAK